MCRSALFSGGQHSRLNSKSSTTTRLAYRQYPGPAQFLGQTLAVEEHHLLYFSGVTSIVARSRAHSSSLIGVSLMMYFPSTC